MSYTYLVILATKKYTFCNKIFLKRCEERLPIFYKKCNYIYVTSMVINLRRRYRQKNTYFYKKRKNACVSRYIHDYTLKNGTSSMLYPSCSLIWVDTHVSFSHLFFCGQIFFLSLSKWIIITITSFCRSDDSAASWRLDVLLLTRWWWQMIS